MLRLAVTAATSLTLSGCATTLDSAAIDGIRGVGVLMPPEVQGERLRFAAVGDPGLDEASQRQIARHVHAACDGRCDFVLSLGDNLYEYGIDPDDLEADTAKIACILGRYPGKRKYLTLGNHDYHPIWADGTRGRAQVEWLARRDDEFDGGYHFYRFDTKLATFWALDTNYLVRAEDPWTSEPKLIDFGETIRAPSDDWKIVFGHHPMLSNGYHGNAGGFLEGDFVNFWSGAALRRFMLRYVVGEADLYLAGHEHNLQFYGRAFGSNTGFAVSGSAAKCTPRSSSPRNVESALLEHYGHGFVIVEATKEVLTLRYYGHDGRQIWGATRGKRTSWAAMEGYPKKLANVEPRCAEELEALERADAHAGGAVCQPPDL